MTIEDIFQVVFSLGLVVSFGLGAITAGVFQ